VEVSEEKPKLEPVKLEIRPPEWMFSVLEMRAKRLGISIEAMTLILISEGIDATHQRKMAQNPPVHLPTI
jgi:hypothetical protein